MIFAQVRNIADSSLDMELESSDVTGMYDRLRALYPNHLITVNEEDTLIFIDGRNGGGSFEAELEYVAVP